MAIRKETEGYWFSGPELDDLLNRAANPVKRVERVTYIMREESVEPLIPVVPNPRLVELFNSEIPTRRRTQPRRR